MRKSGLTGQKMFLTRFDKCVCVCFQLACQKKKKQIQLYLITGQSAPHLSVIKATEQKWEEIGLFVRKCLSATDWIEKPNGQKHSRNAGVFNGET